MATQKYFLIKKSTLKDIASAIRIKKGQSVAYNEKTFGDEITSINTQDVDGFVPPVSAPDSSVAPYVPAITQPRIYLWNDENVDENGNLAPQCGWTWDFTGKKGYNASSSDPTIGKDTAGYIRAYLYTDPRYNMRTAHITDQLPIATWIANGYTKITIESSTIEGTRTGRSVCRDIIGYWHKGLTATRTQTLANAFIDNDYNQARFCYNMHGYPSTTSDTDGPQLAFSRFMPAKSSVKLNDDADKKYFSITVVPNTSVLAGSTSITKISKIYIE